MLVKIKDIRDSLPSLRVLGGLKWKPEPKHRFVKLLRAAGAEAELFAPILNEALYQYGAPDERGMVTFRSAQDRANYEHEVEAILEKEVDIPGDALSVTDFPEEASPNDITGAWWLVAELRS